MPANTNTFLGFNSDGEFEPAWHKMNAFEQFPDLELPDHKLTTIMEQLNTVGALPKIEKVPSAYWTGERSQEGTPIPGTGVWVQDPQHEVILRGEFLPRYDADPVPPKPIEPIKEQYPIPEPFTFANVWDSGTQLPVSTFAPLRDWQEIFVTSELGDFNVGGKPNEQVLVYLGLTARLGFYTETIAFVTGVRVVCSNTLALALGQAVTKFRVGRNQNAPDIMADWLSKTTQAYGHNLKDFSGNMDVLASKRADRDSMNWVNARIFPEPEKPTAPKYGKTMPQMLKAYESAMRTTKERRNRIDELFLGGGAVGFDRSPLEGTYWHLYNSYAQLITHEIPTRGESWRTNLAIPGKDRSNNLNMALEVIQEIM